MEMRSKLMEMTDAEWDEMMTIRQQQATAVARYWSKYGHLHEQRALEQARHTIVDQAETETGGRGEEMDGGR